MPPFAIAVALAASTLTEMIAGRSDPELPVPSSSKSGSSSAVDLRRTIQIKGASAVAAALSEADFDHALRQAAGGDADWLEVVAALRPATDGARSEEIDKALSDALRTNPAAVLRLMRTRPGLPGPAWLCEDRAIEPSPAQVARFERRAGKALSAVRDPVLRASRDACLAALRSASAAVPPM